MTDNFWIKLDSYIATAPLIIDRPRGSRHPRFPQIIYPMDYGYLDGVRGGDGDGLDVWIGSLTPRRLTGVLCSVDTTKRDAELKLLLGCTPQQMQTLSDFYNSTESMGAIIIARE